MSPVTKLSASGRFTQGPTVYTSMLAGNVTFDPWSLVVAANNAGLFRTNWNVTNCFDFSVDGSYALFGDLCTTSGIGASNSSGGFCNSTRLVVNGGYHQPTGNGLTTMWYSDIATKNNGASFGALTAAVYSAAAFNSATRGISYAGYLSATIGYVTIATTGNALNFGNPRQQDYINGGCSSPTIGTSWGSQYGGQNIYIDYVTIAATGNYTNFGSMTQVSNSVTCGASSTRGVGAGITSTSVSTMTNEYITFSSTGNSVSWGTQTVKRSSMMGTAKASTNFVCFGGYNGTGYVTDVNKWAIASGGSASSWGTLASALTTSSTSGGTTSNCHGGV